MAGSPLKRARREAAAAAAGMTLDEYKGSVESRQEFLEWVLGLPADLQQLLEREVEQPDVATFSHPVVQRMAMSGATDKDIAVLLGVTKEALTSEAKEALDLGRTVRRFLLQQRQFTAGVAGDRTMLVWLGKNELGQMDKTSTELSGAGGGPIEIAAVANRTRDKLERLIASRVVGAAAALVEVSPSWQSLPAPIDEEPDAADA